MRHLFLDTNVVIDFLANRQPFATEAAWLFEASLTGNAKIYVSALSYNNIYYVLRRSYMHYATMGFLTDLADMTVIIDVTNNIIRESLNTEFSDYEDAVQYQSAASIPQIDCIVTRNTKDFKKSSLPVLTPGEAIASLKI